MGGKCSEQGLEKEKCKGGLRSAGGKFPEKGLAGKVQ
jgi:hypothetical protein